MLLLIPKELKWKFAADNSSILIANSPMHSYSIVYDKHEKAFKVTYTDRLTNESNNSFHPTSAAAQDWVFNTHYKSKLLDYFTEVFFDEL